MSKSKIGDTSTTVISTEIDQKIMLNKTPTQKYLKKSNKNDKKSGKKSLKKNDLKIDIIEEKKDEN